MEKEEGIHEEGDDDEEEEKKKKIEKRGDLQPSKGFFFSPSAVRAKKNPNVRKTTRIGMTSSNMRKMTGSTVMWETCKTSPGQKEVSIDEVKRVFVKLLRGLLRARQVRDSVEQLAMDLGIRSELEMMNEKVFFFSLFFRYGKHTNQTNIQTNEPTNQQTNKQSRKQTNEHTNKQTNKQINKTNENRESYKTMFRKGIFVQGCFTHSVSTHIIL